MAVTKISNCKVCAIRRLPLKGAGIRAQRSGEKSPVPECKWQPCNIIYPMSKKVQPIRNLETRSISLKNPGGACGLHIFPPKLERTAAGTFCSPKFFRSNFVTILQNPSFLIILPFGFLRSQLKKEYETKSNRLQRAKNFSAETNKTKAVLRKPGWRHSCT